MCIKNLEKCNKIMHVAKRNVILLYFSKLQIQYATNFYMNLFHIIDTYTNYNKIYLENIDFYLKT